MTVPKMPWYGTIEEALSPIEPHITLALMLLAALTIVIAWKGDAVVKSAWFIYLISP